MCKAVKPSMESLTDKNSSSKRLPFPPFKNRWLKRSSKAQQRSRSSGRDAGSRNEQCGGKKSKQKIIARKSKTITDPVIAGKDLTDIPSLTNDILGRCPNNGEDERRGGQSSVIFLRKLSETKARAKLTFHNLRSLTTEQSSKLCERPIITSRSRSISASNSFCIDEEMSGSYTSAVPQRFKFLKWISDGTFSSVYTVQNRSTGDRCAMKVIKKRNGSEGDVKREFEIMMALSHPNICRVYELMEDDSAFYVLLELYRGGELLDKIVAMTTFTESMAANVIAQVLAGIAHTHNRGIWHRDVKPENLVLQSPASLEVVLVDFGLAIRDPGKPIVELCGSISYMAPEIAKNEPHNSKCDIWSLGVVLYVLLVGYPPSEGENAHEVRTNVANGRIVYSPEDWDKVSPAGRNLLRHMLCSAPARRWTAKQCLKHAWLKAGGTGAGDEVSLGDESTHATVLNLRAFQQCSAFAQAVYMFLGPKTMTVAPQPEEYSRELAKLYRSADRDNDGRLDVEEVLSSFIFLHKVPDDRIEESREIITAVMTESNVDYIDFDTFVALSLDHKHYVQERSYLEAVFKILDVDCDGLVSSADIHSAFQDLPWKRVHRLKSIFAQMKNLRVNLEHFCKLMQGGVDESTDKSKSETEPKAGRYEEAGPREVANQMFARQASIQFAGAHLQVTSNRESNMPRSASNGGRECVKGSISLHPGMVPSKSWRQSGSTGSFKGREF